MCHDKLQLQAWLKVPSLCLCGQRPVACQSAQSFSLQPLSQHSQAVIIGGFQSEKELLAKHEALQEVFLLGACCMDADDTQ